MSTNASQMTICLTASGANKKDILKLRTAGPFMGNHRWLLVSPQKGIVMRHGLYIDYIMEIYDVTHNDMIWVKSICTNTKQKQQTYHPGCVLYVELETTT